MEYTLANNCIKDYNHYLLVNQLMLRAFNKQVQPMPTRYAALPFTTDIVTSPLSFNILCFFHFQVIWWAQDRQMDEQTDSVMQPYRGALHYKYGQLLE